MKLHNRLLLILVPLFAGVIVVHALLAFSMVQRHTLEDLKNEARNMRAMLMATRRVYHHQFLDSGLSVNDRTVGFLPAHAMSRIAADFKEWTDSGITFNNVSDRPRNPGNAADPIELEAIAFFREHPEEAERFVPITAPDGDARYHYSRPIWIEEYCLKCHGSREAAPAAIRDRYESSYDYQVGDLRGVMSIKLPAGRARERTLAAMQQHLGIAAIGYCGAFGLVYWLIIHSVARRLVRLKLGANELSRKNYAWRSDFRGSDEIAEVAAAFDEMANRVQSRENALYEANEALATSRDQVEQFLLAATSLQSAGSEVGVLQVVADAVQRSGWGAVVVCSYQSWRRAYIAHTGLAPEEVASLAEQEPLPKQREMRFGASREAFRAGRSYFIAAGQVRDLSVNLQITSSRRIANPGDPWDPDDLAYVPLYSASGAVIGCISLDNPTDGQRPTVERFRHLEFFADLGARAIESIRHEIDREEGEQRQAANLRYLQVMQRMDQIIHRSTDLEELMKNALAEVLEILDCDRAWLLHPCDPDAPSWRVPMECTKPEYPGVFAEGTELPMTPEVREVLQAALDCDGILVHDPATGNSPPPDIAERFTIRTQLIVTMHPVAGTSWLLGVHQCSRERIWTKGEQRLMKDIGQRLADALSSLLIFRDLQESEERFRLATQAASVGVWDWEIVSDQITWSSQGEALFGLEPGGFQGTFQHYMDQVHPDDREMVRQLVEESLETERGYSASYRIIRPDTTVRWVLARGNVHRDSEGAPVRMVGTVADITVRKQAETALQAQMEMDRLLLRELDHRVRNNLSSLMTLIELSRGSARSVDDFASSMQSRTQTIASVHSMLSDSEWSGGDLEGMLDRLIQPPRNTRLCIEGPKVMIPIGQTQSLGLVINELTTNSIKYGAMSVDGGAIDIIWTAQDAESGETDLVLNWRESGGPLIEAEPAASTGTNLIRGLTQSELRGRVVLRYPPEGVAHELHIRLSAAATARFSTLPALLPD